MKRMHLRTLASSSSLLAAVVLVLPLAAEAGVLKVPQQFPTIDAAVAAAGSGDEVVVSRGTYTGDVNANNKTNVTLRAKGKVSIIGTPSVFGTVFLANCTGFTMRGFRIVSTSGVAGIRTSGGSHLTFDRCRVTGGSDGIDVDLSDDAIVRRCLVNGSFNAGIIVRGTNVAVENCKVKDSGDDGIRFESKNARVIGNQLTHIGDDGIAASDADGALIADNRMTGVADLAIATSPTLIATIVGNRVKNSSAGIEADANVLLIQDNRFTNVTDFGIKAEGGSITTVRNRCTRCGIGIVVSRGTMNTVHSDNVIAKSTSNGVQLEGGAMNNYFARNVAKQSGGFDLFDDSQQANTFIDNAFTFVGP